ncbi:MAG: mannosyltransferase family protein [Patescibacteria group bacterium]
MKILKLFLFWRIGLIILTFLGSLIFPLVENGGIGAIGAGREFDFWASWAQWDGGHFYNIAKFGYSGPNEYAFFPLFPLLIKFFSLILFGNLLLAGFLISNIAFLIFLYIFYELVKSKYNQKTATRALITLISFPTAYFAVAFYSEPLFLLLSALTFLLLEKRKFIEAAIFASFASFTRFVGIFLVIPVTFYYLESIKFSFRNLNLNIISIPISLTGIISYCLYLFLKFQDPFYFLTVESTWHRSITNPATTIYYYLTENVTNKPFNDYLDVFLTLAFLIILGFGIRKISLSWWLFSLLVIIVPASTGTLTSMPRYLLGAIPVFVLAGIYLKDRQFMQIFIWSSSLILQVVLAVMFVNGRWTA